MQLSQMFPELGPEPGARKGAPNASVSGDGSFHEARERAAGMADEGAESEGLPLGGALKAEAGIEPGTVLRDASGEQIAQVVEGEEGELRLLMADAEGDGIPLDELFTLLEDDTDLAALADLSAFSEKDAKALLGFMQQGGQMREQQGPLGGLLQQGGVQSAMSDGGKSDGDRSSQLATMLQSLSDGKKLQEGESDRSGRFDVLRLTGVETGGERTSESLSHLQGGNARGAELREMGGVLRQYSTSVETPVQQQNQWSEQIAGKIAWLAGKSIQSAEIHLNPPDMGPIDVRVQVQNDQAQITVNAQNTAVRDMLELNSNRLREMLEQNGLSLSGFDVSGEAAGEGGQGDEGEPGSRDGEALVSRDGESVTTGEAHIQWPSGVDVYA